MLDQILGFHLELTNMCTLKCPRCARTKFIEQFPKNWTNNNLNFDHLKSFLDIDLTGKTFILCGNYGDPIYYDQLFEVIDYLKNNNANVNISTNGSYRTAAWWEELTCRLTKDDSIIFGIDGLPNNFTQYRVNADWETILSGISVIAKSTAKMVWQYIVFSYNQTNIEEAKVLSKNLGFDEFKLVRSDRFDSVTDYLRPTGDMIGSRDESMIQWKDRTVSIDVNPNCKIHNNQHYISAQGYYMPCCFVGDYRFYYKSEFYKNKNLYDISTTTISQILQLTTVNNYYDTLEDAKLSYCTFNCPKL